MLKHVMHEVQWDQDVKKPSKRNGKQGFIEQWGEGDTETLNQQQKKDNRFSQREASQILISKQLSNSL